jgi:hypothetical protein
MISYPAFKKKYPIGKTVCSPEGTYCGQCASLVRTYMKEVHGVVTGPLGNAVDFADNSTFLKYYEKIPDKDRKSGDIMIWGNDPGTWTGEAGHDAIYDGNDYMYNQNFNGSLKVSRNKIFTPGFIGYYRKKGETVSKPTRAEIETAFDLIGRNPKEGEYKTYLKLDKAVLWEKIAKAVWRRFKDAQESSSISKDTVLQYLSKNLK